MNERTELSVATLVLIWEHSKSFVVPLNYQTTCGRGLQIWPVECNHAQFMSPLLLTLSLLMSYIYIYGAPSIAFTGEFAS
jgi:hypothetical protein